MTEMKTITFGALIVLAMAASGCKKAEAKTQGLGDSLRAFVIQNCETGDRYCQVCAYGGKPTIMAIADIEDEAFHQDLVEIQKLYDAKKDKGLTAFALLGSVKNGKFQPLDNDAKAMAKVKALQQKLKISFPMTIVPSQLTDQERSSYGEFSDLYEITKSRTVLFAAADNKVKYAGVMKSKTEFDALAKVIEKTL